MTTTREFLRATTAFELCVILGLAPFAALRPSLVRYHITEDGEKGSLRGHLIEGLFPLTDGEPLEFCLWMESEGDNQPVTISIVVGDENDPDNWERKTFSPEDARRLFAAESERRRRQRRGDLSADPTQHENELSALIVAHVYHVLFANPIQQALRRHGESPETIASIVEDRTTFGLQLLLRGRFVNPIKLGDISWGADHYIATAELPKVPDGFKPA